MFEERDEVLGLNGVDGLDGVFIDDGDDLMNDDLVNN